MARKSKKPSNAKQRAGSAKATEAAASASKEAIDKAAKAAASKVKDDARDPAEVRAEKYRRAAQRETVEAFVVAFILALLFRAFLAEAFVIPTGSMAPTLMGAHKDLVCDQCSSSFQVGASRERTGPTMKLAVVGGICPNCRHVNSMDLTNNVDHATFNGDRILVSKYAYALGDPERWDVIVFKFPGNPKQNYIKRLVGLPNETVTIEHGDVYARPTGSNATETILRKPAKKLLAMRHLVYNTDFQPSDLVQANYPSRWQPWALGATSPPSDSWNIQRDEDGLNAELTGADPGQLHWMRYYHRWPTDQQWAAARRGESLAEVNPYQSRAITDFYAYDSYLQVASNRVYEEPPSMISGSAGRFSRLKKVMNGGYTTGVFRSDYQSGAGPEQFDRVQWGGRDTGYQKIGRDGVHWVGDLILEADLETSADSKTAILELVEAGVKYQCEFDLSTGNAQLRIDDIQPRTFDGEKSNPTAETSVRAGSRHQLRFSNCDDQLLLWVDGDLMTFDSPTTFDAREFRSKVKRHPQYLPEHPLDAAPVALAVRGGTSKVRSLRIDRDKYYIATMNANFGIHDYDQSEMIRLAGSSVALNQIQEVFTRPNQWAEFVGWEARRAVTFEMEEDQFFPMGDNSPESLDARCWAGTKRRVHLPNDVNKEARNWWDDSFVPRDLLVGKAIAVFWPHSWNSPVPFTPNLKRTKLIR